MDRPRGVKAVGLGHRVAMTLGEAFIGRELDRSYRIIRPIGRGGMSMVFEAQHLRLQDRRLAIKVLSLDWASEEVYQRFEREAQILAGLRHPNIVHLEDFNRTDEGLPYLVMEFLEGETLRQRHKRLGRLSLKDARAVLRQVGGALAHAHQRGIVHRDLKPQNIFIQKDAVEGTEVKLLDFGISKLTQGLGLTRTEGVVMGTAAYMSPEQASGRGSAVDARSDIFSIGSVMYLCLTGIQPFVGESDEAIRQQVCEMDPPSLTQRSPDLPPRLDAVLGRAMAKQRRNRYQRVEDFVAAFCEVLDGGRPGQGALIGGEPDPLLIEGISPPSPSRGVDDLTEAADEEDTRPEGQRLGPASGVGPVDGATSLTAQATRQRGRQMAGRPVTIEDLELKPVPDEWGPSVDSWPQGSPPGGAPLSDQPTSRALPFGYPVMEEGAGAEPPVVEAESWGPSNSGEQRREQGSGVIVKSPDRPRDLEADSGDRHADPGGGHPRDPSDSRPGIGSRSSDDQGRGSGYLLLFALVVLVAMGISAGLWLWLRGA